MKKIRKFSLFIFSIILCATVISSAVLAVNDNSVSTCSMDACPDHPYAQTRIMPSQTPSGTYFHYYVCTVCNFAYDSDECVFSGFGDCMLDSCCILCDQVNYYGYALHDFSGRWQWVQYLPYHWRTCNRENCLVEEHGAHDRDGEKFGPVDSPDQDTCSVCGYIWPLE